MNIQVSYFFNPLVCNVNFNCLCRPFYYEDSFCQAHAFYFHLYFGYNSHILAILFKYRTKAHCFSCLTLLITCIFHFSIFDLVTSVRFNLSNNHTMSLAI